MRPLVFVGSLRATLCPLQIPHRLDFLPVSHEPGPTYAILKHMAELESPLASGNSVLQCPSQIDKRLLNILTKTSYEDWLDKSLVVKTQAKASWKFTPSEICPAFYLACQPIAGKPEREATLPPVALPGSGCRSSPHQSGKHMLPLAGPMVGWLRETDWCVFVCVCQNGAPPKWGWFSAN